MSAARTRVMLAVCTLSAITCVRLAQAAPAALVEFAIGNVSAVNGAGVARALAKGAEVLTGDTIDTGTGRAQLRFSDGAYISLQPGSQFRIDEYNYSGKNDDTERSFFSLLKGGMRTITGLIGRTNRRNYQVRVPVATIGIRGTEYTLLFDGSALGSVGEGEISVCNSGGCLDVSSGQSYFVAADNVKPKLSTVRSFLSAPPLPRFVPRHSGDEPANAAEPGLDLGSVYSTNDRVNPDGSRAAFNTSSSTNDDLFGDQIPSGGGPQGGGPRPPITTQPVVMASTIDRFPAALNIQDKTDVRSTTADVEGGRLVSWSDSVGFNTTGTATVTDSGNLGQIAWGRLTNGTIGPGSSAYANIGLTDANSFHYIVAKVTAPSNLPVTGTLSYAIAGGTRPTTTSGGFATLNSSTFTFLANFTLGRVDTTMDLSLAGGNQVHLTGGSAIRAGASTFSNLLTPSGTGCAAGCSADFAGMFAGPTAQYAGFTYGVDGTTSGNLRGALVLRR